MSLYYILKQLLLSMAVSLNSTEDLKLLRSDEFSHWLKEKGYSDEVCQAFEGEICVQVAHADSLTQLQGRGIPYLLRQYTT